MVKEIMEERENLYFIQEKLLNKKLPYRIPGISIDAANLDPQKLEGFFFEILQPSPHLVDVFLGQVHQNGVPGLALALAVKFTILRYAQAMAKGYHYDRVHLWEKNFLDPHEILKHVQDDLNVLLIDLNCTVSLFYGRFNLDYHIFSYISCGYPPILYYNAKKTQPMILYGSGVPFGVTLQSHFHTTQISFNPQDIFLFYSNFFHPSDYQGSSLEINYSPFLSFIAEHAHLDASDLKLKFQKILENSDNKADKSSPSSLMILKTNEYTAQSSIRHAKAKFSSNLVQLQAVRNFVKRACQQTPGNSERLSLQLQLVINEIFCNIVKHSYHNKPNEEIIIESELSDEGIFFTISDKGDSFKPSEIKYPNLAGDQEDGFGIFIIQQICDHISYRPKILDPQHNSNYLRIFKRYFSEEEQMEFSHQIQNQTLIITPQGESLDAKNAPVFKEQVLDLIRTSGLYQLVFDLHHLQFIDSSGLGIFLSIQRTLSSQGGKLKLVRLNKPIRTMFEIVSMHRIFDIFNTVEEAVKSF